MIKSKLMTKAQTTIPQPVRAALQLREGDEIAYEIEVGRVILTNASAVVDDPFATFTRMGQRSRPESLCRTLNRKYNCAR
jgi:antitoxin PrlF